MIPIGELLYDLTRDITNDWISRKHSIPIAEVRALRKLPRIVNLTLAMKGKP